MVISPARMLAFDILRRVETEGAHASDLLYAGLPAGVRPDDARLATELTLGTLRWQLLLDSLLARHSRPHPEKLDLEVRLALRLGIYQLRFLDRVPSYAVVNESAELVKRARKGSAAGLVNAVLRRCQTEARQPVREWISEALPLSERLAIEYSHPLWMVSRWLERFGTAGTEELMARNNLPAETCLTLNGWTTEEAVHSLTQEGISTRPGELLRDALRVESGDVAQSSAYHAGKLSIRDEASQAVPLLLNVPEPARILDLCAAPGGKSESLAQRAGENGLVVAADIQLRRVRDMRGQHNRKKFNNIAPVVLDGTQSLPFSHRFQHILVDAPCSGTGTLGRNPEIRWRLNPADFAPIQDRQAALLRRALEQASRPGGQVLYSTCSLEPEENERVIEQVLAESPGTEVVPAALDSAATAQLSARLNPSVPLASLIGEDNAFRTFPPRHQTDGFFAILLRTKAAR
jgi:16S rRNA (cytosine967-C5)-methyltransferase